MAVSINNTTISNCKCLSEFFYKWTCFQIKSERREIDWEMGKIKVPVQLNNPLEHWVSCLELTHLYPTYEELDLRRFYAKNQEAKLKTNRRSILTYCDRKSKSKKKKKDESDNCSFVRSLVRSTKYWYSRPFSINLIFIFFILSAVPSTFFLQSLKNFYFFWNSTKLDVSIEQKIVEPINTHCSYKNI